ncbi:hypothetical protein AVEN_158098-1 [Araneus ventricosus]|uniref:Uncharacterized protein n=1 Tax=Araneus ventricosus TaxID=182803 RepID=A0A4Y2HSZ2_ARAVE|nr:hypothetical protein AVEN_158098-1 [Araneus ventricosus]
MKYRHRKHILTVVVTSPLGPPQDLMPLSPSPLVPRKREEEEIPAMKRNDCLSVRRAPLAGREGRGWGVESIKSDPISGRAQQFLLHPRVARSQLEHWAVIARI